MKGFKYLSISMSTSLAAGTCIFAGKDVDSPLHGRAESRSTKITRSKEKGNIQDANSDYVMPLPLETENRNGNGNQEE